MVHWSAPSSSATSRRMCESHVRAWSSDGKHSAAVFSMVNMLNTTTLWYSLDNVSLGRLRYYDDWYGTEREEVKRPPTVHSCGEQVDVSPLGCGHTVTGIGYPSIMCQVSFSQMHLCPAQISWRRRALSLKVSYCKDHAPELPRVAVSACAPFFLNGLGLAAEQALRRVKLWVDFMAGVAGGSRQVGRVHLHVLNRGAEVRTMLLGARRQALVAAGVLRVRFWDYYEAVGANFSSNSHVEAPSARRGGDDPYTSPYHAYNLVYTKCLQEEQGSTEWMLIVDVDEYWKSVPRPPLPQLTVSQFLAAAPPRLQQHHFCVLTEECLRTFVGMARPKSAMRVGGGMCSWLGGGHVSLPATTGQPNECFPFPVKGERFDWGAFASRCVEAAQAPPAFSQLANYFSHDAARVGARQEHACGLDGSSKDGGVPEFQLIGGRSVGRSPTPSSLHE